MLKAALKYRDRGLSVIPFVPGGKQPSIAWERFQKRLPTDDEMKGFFKNGANVGCVTGIVSGILVLDCDDQSAVNLLEEHIPETIVTPIATTPRGGRHYFFRCTDPAITTKAGIRPNLDIRANGGVVVLPPSTRKEGAYQWLEGLSILDVHPAPLPPALMPIINNINNALLLTGDKEGCKEFCKELPKMFTQGRRDEDLFHLANVLVKGGMPEGEVMQVLEKMALSCNPPFDLREVPAKIESALKRNVAREINLAQEAERWIFLTDGLFSLTDCYNDLQSLTGLTKPYIRNNLHQIFHRLKEQGVIEKVGNKNGVYRRVRQDSEDIDFLNAPDSEFDIKWPFGIETLVKTMPGNIVVVAGASNAGKSGFLLNVVEQNMDRHDIVYFSSEMAGPELRDRLKKFDRPLTSWRFAAKSKSGNFADEIRPDSINIIDYLELHADFWQVGGLIKEIFDKLKTGIAIIALQKNPGQNYGLGGARSVEKARLYLSMDNHILRIEKGKNWRNSAVNPNGMQVRYKLADGCKFIKTSNWDKA